MPKMRAVDAAVQVLAREGVSVAFGVPGAAINPFYSALKANGPIRHILARHVEGASHMADGYSRARAGNIGVCIGTSGPGGTDMITGMYAAAADSVPILCITGQAPRAKLYKEDFQAIDIEAIAKQVAKWAVTVREPALVPQVFQQAFHVMRSGRPGPVLIDLPFDVQMARDRIRHRHLRAAARLQAGDDPRQAERALAMLNEAERPMIIAGGGVIICRRIRPAGGVRRTDRHPSGADPDGLGRHSGRPSADGRHGRACRPPTAMATRASSNPTSSSASATAGRTGTPARSRSTPRAASSCTSTSSRRRSAACSPPTSASPRMRRPR